MKLWHCKGSRSLRPLWALEEMGLDYELEVLPFPPRLFQPEYVETNPLGTVPYFVDGDVVMTESSGICHYLVERHGKPEFAVPVDHPDYGSYLNWLYHSDATLTFPQTIVMRYFHLEPTPEKQPVGVDYGKWFFARLRWLDAALDGREFLVGDRFTIADIAITYALYLSKVMKIGETCGREYSPQVADYMERMMSRPAFLRADAMGGDENPAET